MEFVSLSLARIPLRRAKPLATLAETCGFTTISVGEAAHDSFAAATAMATATSPASGPAWERLRQSLRLDPEAEMEQITRILHAPWNTGRTMERRDS